VDCSAPQEKPTFGTILFLAPGAVEAPDFAPWLPRWKYCAMVIDREGLPSEKNFHFVRGPEGPVRLKKNFMLSDACHPVQVGSLSLWRGQGVGETRNH
jgi:hypothetical protein